MSAHHDDLLSPREWSELTRRASARVPRWDVPLSVLALLGAAGFYLGLEGERRALPFFYVNFLFWGGLAQAGIVFAAITHVVRAQWGPQVARLGLVQMAYLPLNLLLFIVVALTASQVIPWASEFHADSHVQFHGFKGWWLRLPQLLVRDFGVLVVLMLLSFRFAMTVLRLDRGALAEQRGTPPPRGWRGLDEEKRITRGRGTVWGALLILGYAFGYSILAFDLVMSLEPHWYSTMFGGYFFVTTIYMGLAALVIWSTLLRGRLGLESQLGKRQFHDLAKIMFGFCILSVYTGFAQYLTIWYGDLPEEVSYLLHRMGPDQNFWRPVSLLVFFGGFLGPFLILLNQKIKMIPGLLSILALWILFIGFTERNLLVMPPIFHFGEVALAGREILSLVLITAGFAGLYGLAMLQGLRRAVIVPVPQRIPPIAL